MRRRRRSAAVATGAHNSQHRRTVSSSNTKRGTTVLMYAAQQGDVDRVRRILRAQTSSLFERDRTGKSSLHYCSTSDNLCAAQAADLLVMAAPDLIESRDEDGFTPLHLAVIAGNMQLVTFLLANKADVNAVDNEKHTVVHWATVCGETAALRAVLAAGAPVSTPDVHGGYPLHYAAQMCGGNERDSSLGMQVLQTLLSHSDISVSVMDGDKRQPLLWAASAGSARAVLALIRAGAAVEACDKDGLTALHCAASRGHTDCIDTLLTLCGASPDVIDSNGCTALHYAVTLGHADATALLLAHGADPNRQDRKGRSPAHCGCAKGQFETVKLIGAHGANLWLRNAKGDLPLHEAAASGRRELIKWLLEMRPSQVNARNNDGRCPLHMAALNDNSDMCKILLDAGAQINPILRTSKNVFMTPLDCALQRGFRSTAKYLQLHGGVPASRLGDGHNTQPTNSAVSLQIKDDVTFWGDTSTDSERENGDNQKSSKRTYRKKMAYKLDRKKASFSGSEMDSDKVKTKKVEKNFSKRKNRSGRESSSRTNTGVDSKRSSGRISSKSQVDYSNEIVINGNTEINIQQTKEIIIDNGNEIVDTTKMEVCIPDESQTVMSSEKEKRPRSAKYSKLKNKSGASRSSSGKEIIEKEKKLVGILKDQSTNTSDETTETVIDNYKNKISVHSAIRISDKSDLHDQQSIISNTSEDVDIQKDILVEASVHPPPKEHVDQEKVDEKKEAVAEKEVETQKLEAVKEEIVKKDSVEKVEESKEESIVPSKSKSPEIKEAEIEKVSDEIKEEQVGVSEVAKVEENAAKTEESATTAEKSTAEVEENATKVEESTAKAEESSALVKESTAKAEESVDKIEENIKTAVEVMEAVEKMEEEKAADDTSKQTEVEKKEEEDASKSEEKAPVISTEKKAFEVVEESEIKTIEPKDSVPSDVKSDKIDQEKDEIEEVVKEDLKPAEATTDKAIIKILDEEYEDSKKGVAKDKSDKEKTEIDQKEAAKSQKTKDKKSRKLKHSKKVNIQTEKEIDDSKPEDDANSTSSESSTSAQKTHKSFRVLDENGEPQERSRKISKSEQKDGRSKSEELKAGGKLRRSKIPTPLTKSILSKSDRSLDVVDKKSQLESKFISLPNIEDSKQGKFRVPVRPDSNMSAPLLTSVYSDNERGSDSDMEVVDEQRRSSSIRKKKMKKRSRTRESRSAGSDYESSNLIDSGFEPSPRSSKIPKWKNMSERGVNMSSVTRSIQTNIRRYHLERKIFHHLLELKRYQIRSNQHNEAMLVKRAIDAYHQSCASTVGAGRYVPEDYTFKSFEKFLYESLRKLQKNGAEYLRGLPETPNPLHCTQSTNRCMHATHAYTGIPCAAYLPKMDHHTIPKIGFQDSCKPGTGFLPTINPKKAVTLELSHGPEKQIISLPTDRLDQNKRYYVTFTVKGHENNSSPEENGTASHRHAKSD